MKQNCSKQPVTGKLAEEYVLTNYDKIAVMDQSYNHAPEVHWCCQLSHPFVSHLHWFSLMSVNLVVLSNSDVGGGNMFVEFYNCFLKVPPTTHCTQWKKLRWSSWAVKKNVLIFNEKLMLNELESVEASDVL